MLNKILIVEDNILVSQAVKDILTKAHYDVCTAANGKDAEDKVANGHYKLILLDMILPDIKGEVLLKKWSKFTDLSIIVMTAYGEISSAVDCLKEGVCDFLVKPVSTKDLLNSVEKVMSKHHKTPHPATVNPPKKISKKTAAMPTSNIPQDLIFGSPAMKKTMNMVELISKSDFSSLLITGESGVGKGVLSNAIHKMGPRANKPFVEINCSALPANLIESELFGHKKGAFTDAKEDKIGLFELADGGTIFLDEIGDMEITLQSKLLKAIEEKQFRRIGDTRNIKVDIAIIAATNAQLQENIRDGKFRLDLFYRLNVIPIRIAPLRQRREDIALLCKFFIDIFAKKFKKRINGYTEEAFAIMQQYDWPGNVRELANVVERGCILTQEENIGADLLLLETSFEYNESNNSRDLESEIAGKALPLSQVEKMAIERALKEAKGNKNEAARILGVHRTTLYKKMDEYAINNN